MRVDGIIQANELSDVSISNELFSAVELTHSFFCTALHNDDCEYVLESDSSPIPWNLKYHKEWMVNTSKLMKRLKIDGGPGELIKLLAQTSSEAAELGVIKIQLISLFAKPELFEGFISSSVESVMPSSPTVELYNEPDL